MNDLLLQLEQRTKALARSFQPLIDEFDLPLSVLNVKEKFKAMSQVKISSTQKTLIGFIAFTIIQIFLFVFLPGAYDLVVPGMDYAPVFPAFRIIGIKEIGLMTLYSAITATNDARLMRMTVWGRITVVPNTLFMVFVIGVPKSFLGGVVQDFSSAAITFWALQRDKSRLYIPTFAKPTHSENAIRILVLLSGVVELVLGVLMFLKPFAFRLFPVEWLVTPFGIGGRSLGMMYIAVGGYLIYIGAIRAMPVVYTAIAFQHVSFFVSAKILSAVLTKQYGGTGLTTTIIPFLAGVGILMLQVVEKYDLLKWVEEQTQKKKKAY